MRNLILPAMNQPTDLASVRRIVAVKAYHRDVPGYNSSSARLLRAATAHCAVVWSPETGWRA